MFELWSVRSLHGHLAPVLAGVLGLGDPDAEDGAAVVDTDGGAVPVPGRQHHLAHRDDRLRIVLLRPDYRDIT